MIIITSKINEAMDILQEECAEVIQAVSKCRRFGLDNVKPGKDRTNLQCLEEEIGDLFAMVDILVEQCILSKECIEAANQAKKEKLKKWSNIYE
jgi:NTP pyrophosphatase (non-canonical NTP hydrolase)